MKKFSTSFSKMCALAFCYSVLCWVVVILRVFTLQFNSCTCSLLEEVPVLLAAFMGDGTVDCLHEHFGTKSLI
jgi:hypothetical protein